MAGYIDSDRCVPKDRSSVEKFPQTPPFMRNAARGDHTIGKSQDRRKGRRDFYQPNPDTEVDLFLSNSGFSAPSPFRDTILSLSLSPSFILLLRPEFLSEGERLGLRRITLFSLIF